MNGERGAVNSRWLQRVLVHFCRVGGLAVGRAAPRAQGHLCSRHARGGSGRTVTTAVSLSVVSYDTSRLPVHCDDSQQYPCKLFTKKILSFLLIVPALHIILFLFD
jgi:hypothetical protein